MTMTADTVEANRKYLEDTTPVPPGWQVADNADPSKETVMFWNSLEQVWADVAATLTDEASYGRFCEMWATGTTFLIVPAPVPVAPAPFKSPFAAVPSAAPAIPTPVAQAAPAPVAPAPVVNLAVPPAPSFVPPAPVAAVSFPAPPAATPAPAPAPAPALKVVGLGKKSAPAPTPAQAPAPSGVVDLSHPKPQAESVNLALIERLAKIHAAAAEQIKELAESERALRAEIVKLAFPNGVAEGVNTCNLPDGSSLVVTGKVNRTVDPAKAAVVRENLAEAGASFDDYFEWKPTLKGAAFKVAAVQIQSILADMVTAKEGTPSVEIRKPKGV